MFHSTARRFALRAALALALFGAALVCGCARPAAPEPPAPKPDAAPATPASLEKILGRWVRDDGGYVLELRSGAAGGVLDAAYFNPKPIAVSRAAWLEAGGRLQVLVELTGSGYDGSTYILHYEPQADRLVGEYRQAVQRQTYEIAFVRQSSQR